MRSVRPGGMFVNRAVTTLQVIVQTPIWSVAVERLIPVVAQMDQVQTGPTIHPLAAQAAQAVRAKGKKWSACGMPRQTVTTTSIRMELVNRLNEGGL
jgi:hypothetical protein